MDHYCLSISPLLCIVDYTPQSLHHCRVLLEVLLHDLGDPGRTIGYHTFLIGPKSGSGPLLTFRFLWSLLQLSGPRDLT